LHAHVNDAVRTPPTSIEKVADTSTEPGYVNAVSTPAVVGLLT
jgi:hypothetical protein